MIGPFPLHQSATILNPAVHFIFSRVLRDSTSRYVGPLVGRSPFYCPLFTFLAFLSFLSLLLLPRCPMDFLQHCSLRWLHRRHMSNHALATKSECSTAKMWPNEPMHNFLLAREPFLGWNWRFITSGTISLTKPKLKYVEEGPSAHPCLCWACF